MDKCMPTPPKVVGREFVKTYYTLLNASPENMHCFYTDSASFIHDDIDSNQRQTISATGKMAIRDTMLAHLPKYNESRAHIAHVETMETLHDCLIVQVNGEISYNDQPMRPFSQSIVLTRTTPFHYFVQNDIFRFCDFESNDEQYAADEPIVTDETVPSQNETDPMDQSDWGTQCEDIEPFEERALAKQTVQRVNEIDTAAPESEVKLDISDSGDSGLSSDAEKAIIDIQSLNLKNILQETRAITKESVMKRSTPTPPAFIEETQTTAEQQQQQKQQHQLIEATTTAAAAALADDEITENKNALFRDSCILTIGNVVNPNIEFDDAKSDGKTNKTENEQTHENVDEKNDDNSISSSASGGSNDNGKNRNRKRKDKRKPKGDISMEKALSDNFNKDTKENDTAGAQTDTKDDRPADDNHTKSIECAAKDETEKSSESEAKTAPTETPEPPVKKSYADLAKSGTDEWIDVMANRRDSKPDKLKTRAATLPRRNSRNDKPTPQFDGNSRISPNSDLLQVFIGNIPHTASEDDIRKMFTRFGHLVRIRFHSNIRKEWLPRYAFISYDNLQSVRQCLSKKNTFYWPENDRQNGTKLNVNGDRSVDIWDDNGNQRSNDAHERTREFKRFSKNFVIDSKDGNSKRSPHTSTNITDTMRNERRKSSTRA